MISNGGDGRQHGTLTARMRAYHTRPMGSCCSVAIWSWREADQVDMAAFERWVGAEEADDSGGWAVTSSAAGCKSCKAIKRWFTPGDLPRCYYCYTWRETPV